MTSTLTKENALLFCLRAIVRDNRLTDLREIMSENSEFGGFEGSPGWIIERRNAGEVVGYEDWPQQAMYRAFVDPSYYIITQPEMFCERDELLKSVDEVLMECTPSNPQIREQPSRLK
ncbi:MAG: hypothetical protein Q4G71_04380 [Pseudomonadota bacterium]|nr:hypothetical protein [Pseudomonadota bacterium]